MLVLVTLGLSTIINMLIILLHLYTVTSDSKNKLGAVLIAIV